MRGVILGKELHIFLPTALDHILLDSILTHEACRRSTTTVGRSITLISLHRILFDLQRSRCFHKCRKATQAAQNSLQARKSITANPNVAHFYLHSIISCTLCPSSLCTISAHFVWSTCSGGCHAKHQGHTIKLVVA